jgi:hypothetical protein
MLILSYAMSVPGQMQCFAGKLAGFCGILPRVGKILLNPDNLLFISMSHFKVILCVIN